MPVTLRSRRPRQLRHPQASQGESRADAASSLRLPLHPGIVLLAQCRREVVLQADPAAAQTRRVSLDRRSPAAINRFLAETDADPKPFVWTAAMKKSPKNLLISMEPTFFIPDGARPSTCGGSHPD